MYRQSLNTGQDKDKKNVEKASKWLTKEKIYISNAQLCSTRNTAILIFLITLTTLTLTTLSYVLCTHIVLINELCAICGSNYYLKTIKQTLKKCKHNRGLLGCQFCNMSLYHVQDTLQRIKKKKCNTPASQQMAATTHELPSPISNPYLELRKKKCFADTLSLTVMHIL